MSVLRWRSTVAALALAAYLATGSGATNAQLSGEWMADNLRTGCAPMGFTVRVVGDAKAIGLTENTVRNAAESRLRAARLYRTIEAMKAVQLRLIEESQRAEIEARKAEQDLLKRIKARRAELEAEQELRAHPLQTLNVDISVLSSAFSVRAWLYRDIPDTGALGETVRGTVIVWSTSGMGTHGGDAQLILGHVSRYLDKFLTEYLRANPECG